MSKGTTFSRVSAQSRRPWRVHAVSTAVALLLTFSVASALGAQVTAPDWAKLAPYPDIIWSEPEQPVVLVDGRWYELTSIDGVPLMDILGFARVTYGPRWQKRFDEDLVQVLSEMGAPPGATVSLGLRDPETGVESVRTDVPMTEDNRGAIMDAGRAREAAAASTAASAPASGAGAAGGAQAESVDLWLWEVGGGPPVRATEPPAGPGRTSGTASLSADGRWAVFESNGDFGGLGAPNGGGVQLWLLDLETRDLKRLTSASGPGRTSRSPVLSGDGSLVVFESDSDFLGEGVEPRQREIWLHEVASGRFRRLTHTPPGSGLANLQPTISRDGSTVAFVSNVAYDTGEHVEANINVWLADVATGALTRVTRSVPGGRYSMNPVLDATGSTVAFESASDLLGEGNVAPGQYEIWSYDVGTGSLKRVTRSNGPPGLSAGASVSADGSRIVFVSDADLAGEGHPDGVKEAWLYDAADGSLERLTRAWQPARDAGTAAVLHPDVWTPRIAADGRTVVFASDADLLAEGLPPDRLRVWRQNLADGRLTRIEMDEQVGSGVAMDGEATRFLLFQSSSDRNHAAQAASAAAVTEPVEPTRPPLTADAVARDLDAFQTLIESRWSYLRTTGVDYRGAIAALRARAAGGMAYDEFGLELQRIIALFVDGHARVRGFAVPPGRLPFFIEATEGGRFVAIRNLRDTFVDPDRPFVTAIDGLSMDEWVRAASAFVPKSAPHRIVRDALDQLADLRLVREELGIAPSPTVRVRVESQDGSSAREVTLRVPAAGGANPYWPRTTSAVLDGDVGYLRLGEMDEVAVEEVATWMPRFASTRGLIVDVRGNTGGSRDALRALFPYLMSAGDPPRVVNAAKYRLHPQRGEDHLGGSRYMFRADSPQWIPAEREAIARFRETFEPQWTPPAEEFSDWHYLVMSREMNPGAFTYGRPVVVLLDENAFSATDIFLSAMKGWPGVTLVGTPSGGGSARTESFLLPLSGLEVTLGSMASFQWTGQLYDGNGIHPDVLVYPDAEYFIEGGRDNVLDRALELLRR